MRILIFGSGVQGSVYGNGLIDAGNDVTFVARGLRLQTLRSAGIALRNLDNGSAPQKRVRVVEEIGDEEFDIVLVTVRREQIDEALATLSTARAKRILYLYNHANGSTHLSAARPDIQTLIGFPGVAGGFAGDAIEYVLVPEQHTVVGSPGGGVPREIVQMLRSAHFPTDVVRNIDPWLQQHAVFVSAIWSLGAQVDYELARVAQSAAMLDLFVCGVRQGFLALESFGLAPAPLGLRTIFCSVPKTFSIWYWRNFFRGPRAKQYFEKHLRHAPEEGSALVSDLFATFPDLERIAPKFAAQVAQIRLRAL